MDLIDYGNNAVYWTSASQLFNSDIILLQSHQSSLTCLLCLLETNRCGRKGAIHRWGCGKAQHVRHPLHPQCFELLANLQLAQKIFQGMDSPIASSQSRWNCCNKARSELALITLVLDGFGVKENLGIDICQDMFHVFQNPGAVIFGRTCTKLYLGFAYKCSLCPSDCFCTVGNASRAQATALIRFFGNEL